MIRDAEVGDDWLPRKLCIISYVNYISGRPAADSSN